MPTTAIPAAEAIARALAERRVVMTTTPGAIAAATGLPAREIGLAFSRNRAELNAACAAVGVTLVEYQKRVVARKTARIELIL